jgi:hypothetical protein
MPLKQLTLAAGIAALVFLFSASARATDAAPVPISDLTPVSAQQDYGSLELDRSVQGQTLTIGERTFARGLGTHANSRIVYDLSGHCTRFTAWVGVDAEMAGYTQSSVVFQVLGDGRKLFDSGVMRLKTPAQEVSVDLHGVKELTLVVTDAGDGITCDHADWAEASVVTDVPVLAPSAPAQPDRSSKYQVRAKNLLLNLSANGEIVGAVIQGKEKALVGGTRLGGCVPAGAAASVRNLPHGGIEFSHPIKQIIAGRSVTELDRFQPAGDSVRWEIEMLSDGSPWSASIDTELQFPATTATRFWTAWSDPAQKATEWRDPLVFGPLANATWSYGGQTTSGDYLALPLATLAEPADDSALSVVFSPADVTLVGSRLTTTAAGALRFSRPHHRLGAGQPVRFALDLVAHEADWRGGLRWMTARYPQFFDPPNPQAGAMAGGGAYSGDEDPVDVAKLKAMAFRINWKLSDDFPYMGMFLPPITNADQTWDRSGDESAPPDKPRRTSARRLNDYARYMRTNGFYVLDYFNVTEFGKNMAGDPVRKPGDPDLWQDPRAFLTTQLPGAILLGGAATCYNASVVDAGDPAYQAFLLEQVRRHIQWIPDSAGICIDRLDWLARVNTNADDGASWINGGPARSLGVSWLRLLDLLGPELHAAGKVIFVNPIYSRLDLLRQVDGIYTEFGQDGRSLNASALMGLRKPVLAWSYNETLHQPDPDAFFQRHLLLGVFPTVPYPWNNHCITPEPAADQVYTDYGPLLDALRGKQWVLAPHCVEVTGGAAKANLFQVPAGYVLPVTFGGTAAQVQVTLRNTPGLHHAHCTVLHPGGNVPAPLSVHPGPHGTLTLQVPLQRGCGMVLLRL